MAISVYGNYTSPTAYRVGATGLTSGRYRLFVRNYTNGSADGWYCHVAKDISDGVIDYRTRSGLSYNGSRAIRLYRGTDGNYDVGTVYYSLPSTLVASDTISAYSAGTYDLVCASEIGVSSFVYLKNTTSGTGTSTTRFVDSFDDSSGYIYLKSITLKSGYTHPVYAVTGSGTVLFKVTNADGTFKDHYVSTSSTSGSTRYVYLRATEIVDHTLRIHFDNVVNIVRFSTGEEVQYDSRLPYRELEYSADIYFSASNPVPSFQASYMRFTGSVYWGTRQGAKTYLIATFNDGTLTKVGTSAQRKVDYTSADPRDIYITSDGITYWNLNINPNGGNINGHTSEYTVSSAWSSADTYTLPSTGTYSGMVLEGFRKNSSTTGNIIAPGSSVSIDSNTTFYAIWKNNTFWGRIHYDGNGGTAVPQYSTPVSRIGKGTVNDTVYGSASRINYVFKGWTTTRMSDDAPVDPSNLIQTGDTYGVYCSGESQSDPKDNTLYAFWTTGATTYYGQIIYKGNGGTFSGGATQIKSQVYSADSILAGAPKKIKIEPAQTPTRTGYTFSGWAGSDGTVYNVGSEYDFVLYSTSSDNPTEFEILAQWTINQYTLTLDGNGGRFGVLGPTTRTVSGNYGSSISLSSYSPTRNKYTFTGWKDANGNAYSKTGSITLTGNITLYAQWSKDTIDKFYWDNGTGSTDSTIFRKDASIPAALTVGRWDRFRAKIVEVLTALGSSHSYSYSGAVAGAEVSAADFTAARNAINSMSTYGSIGVIPGTKNKGDAIGASLYNGTSSLKSGLNTAIDNYNNTD